MALRLEALSKAPSPRAVDHVAEVALPPMVPLRGAVSMAQMVSGAPASTVAAGSIVMTTSADAATQGPAGSLVVSVSVTVPAAIFPVPDALLILRLEALSKAPSPRAVDHVAEVAPPPMVPASVTVAVEQRAEERPAGKESGASS